MKLEDLKQLVRDGLAAQQAGGELAAAATDDILNSATHPDLRAALEQGNEMAKEWTKRVERAIAEVGSVEAQDNKIMEANYEVSKEIRDQAQGDEVRDLGIVTSGQLALHYWIASFGTMASYAGALHLSQTAQDMKTSLEEAKKADEQLTIIAKSLLTAS